MTHFLFSCIMLAQSQFLAPNQSITLLGLGDYGVDVPVHINTSAGIMSNFQYWNLVTDQGDLLPMQTRGLGNDDVFILPKELMAKHDSLALTLKGSRAQHEKPFEFEQDKDHLKLTENGKPVLVFNHGMLLKEGVPEDRRRSCYIHPLYGLDGEVITDDFPSDHYHHRGLYFGWPRVMVDGKSYDIWHLKGIEPRFEEYLYQKSGAVCASFGVKIGWHVGEKKVVDERYDFTIYRAGDVGRVIDWRAQWRSVDTLVKIAGQTTDNKGYGGINYRPAPRTETYLTSAAGRLNRDWDRLKSPWGDFSAKYLGRDNICGMAIMPHPDNPLHPPGWIFRFYGYLGTTWPGLEPIEIPTTEPLVVNHRVWIHRGDAEEGRAAEAYSAFLHAYDSMAYPEKSHQTQ